MLLKPITPCLWYDGQAKEAADYYVSIFPNSKITSVQKFNDSHKAVTDQDTGSVLTVAFELNGQPFVGLNGGPHFKFNEAVSFTIQCKDQAEIDYYWDKLGEGGDESKQRCGWLSDRFGVSWQVVPAALVELMVSSDPEKAKKTTAAMLQMKKFDIAALKAAGDS
ncbi:putative 3-demethylubiquinone-9 3-methyltransferase [Eremomyces bilateralis CBS 781.70]|uniref:3-demethylubiquinone-9 3-methyltransferase n=1 Tax=Eremomyces bilateralis CBS 781.70 TaxID=1392243 RepID=A0A6G1GAH3_9PEZI|nr:putative 3-demethylubiquinone-9 3-methyltransferase [Eremomyces bilateralis CBS 781.70]KAF1815033.1 putative 3-demethylubiquinone-9 3-methyltransferase [Eremomyces bilateralis CBS 781.70]